jgi:hypothetical protein
MAKSTRRSVTDDAISRYMELFKLFVSTATGSHAVNILETTQVIPKLPKTSKTLDPIAFVIAISPYHSRAVLTDASRSGTDVPAARIVSAMITCGICRN